MSEFDLLARDLGTSGRSLRRAAERRTIRCRRRSPRRAELSAAERRYLRRHWPLLSSLVRALRTQHNVRLAVLFGSLARGDGDDRSDVDLLVSFADESGLPEARLGQRLSELLDREVQIVLLPAAKASPLLLVDALREGRVLVDRDAEWPQLEHTEPHVRRTAERKRRALEEEAWRTLNELGAIG